MKNRFSLLGLVELAAARPAPRSYGPAVELAVPPTDVEGGPWTVVAYEVELKGYRLADGSYAKITATDIDEMVKNFARYPKSPLVVEHADTRETVAKLHPEWAEPRGHVVALRKGTMTRTVGGFSKVVTTLEARFDVSPEVRLSIVGDPVTQAPPTWPFCSITTAKGVDEETGLSLGTVLHSVSLTSHPRLADLPRLAASQAPAEHGYWYGEIECRGDVLSMLRSVLDLPVMTTEAEVLSKLSTLEFLAGQSEEASGVDTDDLIGQIRRALGLDAMQTAAAVLAAVRTALTTLPGADGAAVSMSRGSAAPNTEKPMLKFLELAAEMNIPAANEDAAQAAVIALARDGAAVRTTLQLAVGAPLAGRLAELVTAGAELPKVKVELAALQATEKTRAEAETRAAAERAEVELARRVDEVCLAKGLDRDEVGEALLAFGRSDRAAFDAKYPPASVQELAQRAQDPARLGTVATATKTSEQPKPAPGAKVELSQQIAELRGVYAEAGYELSVSEAVDHLQRGETIEAARKHLQLG
ncbi:MAG: hypothetical protein Q8S73_36875 [Deltaproteobacteria bacterium]|nr:hypothetical protein [Myxococcales bacterium]MDP3219734.1 hypothetical protein [Deltaproteobacteria bacterium]